MFGTIIHYNQTYQHKYRHHQLLLILHLNYLHSKILFLKAYLMNFHHHPLIKLLYYSTITIINYYYQWIDNQDCFYKRKSLNQVKAHLLLLNYLSILNILILLLQLLEDLFQIKIHLMINAH